MNLFYLFQSGQKTAQTEFSNLIMYASRRICSFVINEIDAVYFSIASLICRIN